MNKNIVVALTGQSGAGKSSLGRYFVSQGYTVIDCDEVAKDIHSDAECQAELCIAFGDDIVKDGAIDKPLLAKRAFSDAESLSILTSVTHPFIIKSILEAVEDAFDNGESIVIVDGAVIIGHEFEKYCDKFIVVTCDREKQYERLVLRDNITREQAVNRIAKQTKLETLLNRADFVVYNNGTQQEMENQGAYILRTLNKM
ncbi:MAG: dephospho-CoA kinase [Oscillospiraceae bacterium]|nr:dephospho-CoA kinase [Oscillospiraceae bacterium]